VGYRRSQLVGRPIYEFVAGGPVFSEREWRRLAGQRRFDGVADLVRADNGRVRVEFAGHPEIVTGRQFVLAVAMRTGRTSRGAPKTPGQAVAAGTLSSREREVVRLIALGYSGPEIASELDLAHDTVRSHVRNAMGKAGARSRAQLVAIALGDALVLR
jgi:DNA-binding NarL/FixJ family response regulator